MRIAVIGAGISGLGAAWALRTDHQVTLYEQAATLGGHSNTLEAVIDGRAIPVDTGFIVYNTVNYPNLVELFRVLDVATEPSDMSFAVSFEHGALEYSGTDLKGLIAQSRNLVRPRFWRMVVDVLRFYRDARAALRGGIPTDLTLGEFLDRGGYAAGFVDDHLLPMGAAIWSTPIDSMRGFPLLNFVRFFDAHGLLRLTNRPRWRTVTGGSRAYVARIAAALGARAIRHAAVTRVRRLPGGVEVTDTGGETRTYDHAILACHGDQALRLLSDPDDTERRVLGAFRFQPNRAVLHSDPALMPKRRAAWASWNYLAPDRGAARTGAVAVTYWMNRLQNLDPARPLFVTLNAPTPPHAELTHRVIDYDHPVFDRAAVRAQAEIAAIQGARRTWFAGAWLGYGFHEDGLKSGLAVARALGAVLPWPTDIAPAGRDLFAHAAVTDSAAE